MKSLYLIPFFLFFTFIYAYSGIDVKTTDASSCGESDGTATITVSGATGNFEYSVDGGTYQSSNTFNKLAAGSHTAKVRDKDTKCEFSKSFLIKEANNELKVSVSGFGSREICQGGPPPSVTLTASASGGSGEYEYSWPGGTKIVSAGRHSVTVTDKKTGCKASIGGDVFFVTIVCSRDPNDILGPDGYGPGKIVSKFEPQPYKIRFENDPEFATAPAQIVRITHPIDAKANIFSFRLADFGFGSFTFQVPENKTFYSTRLNVVDSLGIVVDITAGIDVTKKEAFWIFESKDPVTGLPPTDATLGFLPVNDSTAIGEGFVTFTIKPANTTVTGDTLYAEASIIFDDNAPLATPKIYNTIDAVPPTGEVNTALATSVPNEISINWTGKDEAKGSGVRDYALYVSENGGKFSKYESGITDSTTVFIGKSGNTYSFFTLATDNVGNQEPMKAVGEANITIGTDSTKNNAPIFMLNGNPVTSVSIDTCYKDAVERCIDVVDPDGDNLVYALPKAPLHGSALLTKAEEGVCITYQPAVNYTGPDTFTISACDGKGLCDTLTVNITTNEAPYVSFAVLTPVLITTPTFELTGGVPAGGIYSGTGVSNNSFNPSVAGEGIHTITYTYTDEKGCSNSAARQIVVGGNINLSFGLVGHWPMNEGSGVVANDASGSGNHGQLVNAPTWTTGINSTGGLAISGQNKYVSVNTLTWQPNVYSVSWWIKPASLKNYNQLLRSKNGYWQGFLFHTTTDGEAHVGTTLQTRLVAPAGTVELFKWQHFVFVFNQGEAKLYKDGALVASKTGMAASQPWQGLLIGAPDKNNIDGTIDEVRVYDRVLAFAEVTALSDRPEQDPLSVGLVGHWPMNEGSGAVVNDVSGSGNHGQLINAPVWTTEGTNNTGAIVVNGQDKYITVNTLTWQPNVYSVSWWVKPASLKNYNQLLRSKNGYWQGFLFHTTSDGQAHVGTTSETRLATPAGTVEPYKWQHFVFVFNQGEAKLYKDGALVASKTGMAASQPWQGLLIGTPDKNNIDGTIDEVRVYDRVLAFAEVTALSDRPEQDPLSVGLVGHWPMNEGIGSVANDASGSGNHGQLINNPIWTSGINSTGGLGINGGKYVSVNTLTWQPNVYSVSWWIKPASLKNYNQLLRSKNGYWQGFLFHTTTDGEAHVGTTLQTRLVAPAGTVELFKWQHFVFVFNQGEAKLYKDGALVASKTGMAASQPWQGLLIGAPDKNNIDGTIDEVRVYDRVLALEEVENIFQAASISGAIAARLNIEPSEISDKKAEFKVYPVPADKKVNLEFTLPIDEEVLLTIYDLKGTLVRVVYSGKVESNKVYTFELNTDGLANGVYLSRLAGKSFVEHQKIVIQK